MSYQIRVNCTCGKILKIPEKYAGKKGRCPSCGKKIAIPSMDEIQNKMATQKESEPDIRNCPTCGAYLNPGDVVCISCHTNLSTGEWDANSGLALNQTQGKNWQFIGVFVAIGLLIFTVGIILINHFTQKPTPIKAKLEPLKNKTNLSKPRFNKIAFKSLMNMPDGNISDLDSKLIALENFLERQMGSKAVIKRYVKLLKKKKELVAKDAYGKLKSKNVVEKWLLLNKLNAKYEETEYAKKVIVPDLKNIEEQMITLAHKQVDNAKEALDSKNHKEVVLSSVAWFSRVIKEAYNRKKFIEKVDTLVAYTKAAVEPPKPVKDTTSTPPQKTPEQNFEDELNDLKDNFNDSLAKHREDISKWRFSKALDALEPIYKKSQVLTDKFPEDTTLKKIATEYEETKLLVTAWNYMKEGAAKLRGKTVFFSLKEGKVIAGTVVKYKSEKLYIKGNKTKKKIALIDISPKYLGDMAIKNNKENGEAHVALACFFKINNEDTLCLNAVEDAKKLNVEATNVEKYEKWARSSLEEKKAALAKAASDKADAATKKAEEAKKIRDDRLRRRAWNLVRRMLKDYKAKKDIRVLEYLFRLKKEVGDKPDGRDILLTINSILESKEGHSLKKIAGESFEQCDVCRGETTLKCKTCKGDGTISGKKRQIGKGDHHEIIEGPSIVCPDCKGVGTRICPYCSKKRQNRSYILIKAYYGNF